MRNEVPQVRPEQDRPEKEGRSRLWFFFYFSRRLSPLAFLSPATVLPMSYKRESERAASSVSRPSTFIHQDRHPLEPGRPNGPHPRT